MVDIMARIKTSKDDGNSAGEWKNDKVTVTESLFFQMGKIYKTHG